MIKHSFLSELGTTTLYSENNKIVKIILDSDKYYNDLADKAISIAKKQIIEYLAGKRKDFDFPYKITGTDFFKSVLTAMKKIPYSETFSYSKLADKSGHKNAIRACGTVCKNNPLPLIFPCHRVIRKNGVIGEFNGGIALKKFLLDLERKF